MIGCLPPDLDFPVIQYTDRTLFLKDKARLKTVVMGTLVRAAVRRMLLRTDLTVPMPYTPTLEESAFHTKELTDVLEEGLGMRVLGVALAAPPGRPD